MSIDDRIKEHLKKIKDNTSKGRHGAIYINREYFEELKDMLSEKTGSKGVVMQTPTEQDYQWAFRYSRAYNK